MKRATKKASVGRRVIQGLQEFADALDRKEPIAQRFTCRAIDLNLQPTAYSPESVKRARQALGASQSVCTRLLGVSVKTVRAWEQGIHTPSDIACRFMDEIRLDPAYFIARLSQSAVAK